MNLSPLLLTVVLAAVGPSVDLQQCRKIDNDVERLACYDQIGEDSDNSSSPPHLFIEKQCLEILRGTLKAPSTLKVESVFSAPSSGRMLKLLRDDQMPQGQSQTAPGTVVSVAYDAQNSYGAMLRGFFQCDYTDPPFVDSRLKAVYPRMLVGEKGPLDKYTVEIEAIKASAKLRSETAQFIESHASDSTPSEEDN